MLFAPILKSADPVAPLSSASRSRGGGRGGGEENRGERTESVCWSTNNDLFFFLFSGGIERIYEMISEFALTRIIPQNKGITLLVTKKIFKLFRNASMHLIDL